MGTMLVRHKVKDVPTWRKAFEAHKPAQSAAGLSNPRVFCSADDPKEVVVLMDFQDLGRAKQFGASPDLKSKMTEGAVLDAPSVFFLNTVN